MCNVAFPCCNTNNTDHIPTQDARAANLALAVGQEERFFNKLEDDVSRIIQQEKRREQYTNSHGHEVNTSTEHEPVSRLIPSTYMSQIFVFIWPIKDECQLLFLSFFCLIS